MALTIGLAAGFTALRLLPPRYVAEALLLIEPRRSPVGSEIAAAAMLDRDSATIDSQVQVLQSRGLAQKVVKRLATGAAALATGAEIDPADALLAALEVERRGSTRVLAVRAHASDPEIAARIANAVVDTYLQEQLAAKRAFVGRTTGWIANRLRSLERQVAEAESRAVAFRERNAHLFDTALAQVEDRLAELERDRVAATAARRALEARIRRLKEAAGDGGIASAALGAETSLLRNLEAARAELARREAELEGRYGERHPARVDLRREKAQLDAQIAAERRSIMTRLAAEMAEAEARERSLAEDLERVRRIASESRRAELHRRELEREVELQRRLYESFAGRLGSTSDPDSVEQPDARVIAAAAAPRRPVFPDARLVLPASVVTSLGLGLIGLFVAQRLDRSYTTTREITASLGLPTLALIPELGRRRARGLRPHDYVVEQPRSRLAEGLRELLARIRPAAGSDRAPVVLLASALPQEGKSTIALGLARIAAIEGLRVLLIDGDLCRPALADMVGCDAGAGLADLVAGTGSLETSAQVDPASGVRLMTGGARAGRGGRHLAAEALRRRLVEAAREYDLVLVDSAPLAAVADTQLLAPAADAVLLVVRWQATPAPVVEDALERLVAAGATPAGVVLSRVDAVAYARYGEAAARLWRRRLDTYYRE